VYSPETFSLSDLFTANGMPARCRRKIMEIKMGIESLFLEMKREDPPEARMPFGCVGGPA